METVRLAEREIDFAALDALIRREVPSGRNVRGGEHPFNAEIDLSELRCAHSVSLDWARRSIGTLGGGNHFIEIDRAENGALYLVVHSGSRYLGTQVCAYYQEQGQLALRRGAQERVNALIAEYRAAGRQREIRSALKELDGERVKRIPKDLAYVEGELFEDYIHDMHITQRFAALNRKAITDVILRGMGLTKVEAFTTVHNYIDTEKMILRKGAVSAEAGEKLLIPINMRDGSLICIGKGNEEWNCSAPHGAGRIMSRTQAAAHLSMDEYAAEMEGVCHPAFRRRPSTNPPWRISRSMRSLPRSAPPPRSRSISAQSIISRLPSEPPLRRTAPPVFQGAQHFTAAPAGAGGLPWPLLLFRREGQSRSGARRASGAARPAGRGRSTRSYAAKAPRCSPRSRRDRRLWKWRE